MTPAAPSSTSAPATQPSTGHSAPAAGPVAAPSPPSKPASAAAGWSQQDIDQAKARCTQLLRGLDIVAIPQTPLKEGQECGSPAPVELVSVGKNPQVTFSPPVTVTCDMAAALNTWITRDLQPLARKHLGGNIVQVATMSSYSCRNAYGRLASRLSEHGRANALDIRNFLTANGDAATVLSDWGPTGRDIRAQVAAARAAAQKAEAARAATNIANQKKSDPASKSDQPASIAATKPDTGISTGTIAAPSIPGLAVGTRQGPSIGITLPESGTNTGLGLSTGSPGPQRLGGPKEATKSVVKKSGPENAAEAALNRTQFLRQAHETGCKIFGTILGPEANEAHRNHFHVDMAERRTTNFCE